MFSGYGKELADKFGKEWRGKEDFLLGDTVTWSEEAVKKGLPQNVGEGPFEAITELNEFEAGKSPDVWMGIQKIEGGKKLVYTRIGGWKDYDEVKARAGQAAGPEYQVKIFATKWFKKFS